MPRRWGSRPVHAVGDDVLADEGGEGLALGDLDVLAAAGPAALPEGQGDGAGGGGGGDGVAVADAGLGRRAAGVAGEVGEAGELVGVGAEGDVVLLGAGLAVRGHGDEGDAGVGRGEGVVAEAEVAHDLGAEVFDDDVGSSQRGAGRARGRGRW